MESPSSLHQRRPPAEAPVSGSTQKPGSGALPLPAFLAGLPQALQKAQPAIEALARIANAAEPHLLKAWSYAIAAWAIIAPYHPEEFGTALFGLMLAFLGGHYLLLVSAIEAYKLCGWDTTMKYLHQLYDTYLEERAAWQRDDQVDENNDGIADVRQISRDKLFTRKLLLVLRSCDPDAVSRALSGLYTGLMGVVAVLRVEFAQTLTLGAKLGDIFCEFADRFLRPILQLVVPPDYHKWLPVVIRYGCRCAGVSVAFMVQRVISAFYSSIRGGQMFATGLLHYCGRRGLAAPFDEGSVLFVATVLVVAFTGFATQLSSGFSLPFPLSFFALPFDVLETLLTWLVGMSSDTVVVVA